MKKVFSILALVLVTSFGLTSCESDAGDEASLYENVKGTDGDDVPIDRRATDGDDVPIDRRATDGDDVPIDRRTDDGNN
jgi:hypothetical protein